MVLKLDLVIVKIYVKTENEVPSFSSLRIMAWVDTQTDTLTDRHIFDWNYYLPHMQMVKIRRYLVKNCTKLLLQNVSWKLWYRMYQLGWISVHHCTEVIAGNWTSVSGDIVPVELDILMHRTALRTSKPTERCFRTSVNVWNYFQIPILPQWNNAAWHQYRMFSAVKHQ